MKTLTDNQSTSLESLRGIASILVALCHIFQIFIGRYIPEYSVLIAFISQSSVMIFFVMSGILIGKSAQNNRRRNGYFSFASYISSRALRILPPLVFCLMLMLLISYAILIVYGHDNFLFHSPDVWVAGRDVLPTANTIISVITFTNGFTSQWVPFNAPLWSLPYEVWYYLVAGLLLTKRPVCIIIAIFIYLSLYSLKLDFMLYSLVWLSGFVISYIDYEKKVAQASIFLIMCVSFALSAFYMHGYIKGTSSLMSFNTSAGILYSSLIFIFIFTLNIKISALKNTARFSYTLYLVHFPIMLFVYKLFESRVYTGFYTSLFIGSISFLLSVVISSIGAKFFENKATVNKMFSRVSVSRA